MTLVVFFGKQKLVVTWIFLLCDICVDSSAPQFWYPPKDGGWAEMLIGDVKFIWMRMNPWNVRPSS